MNGLHKSNCHKVPSSLCYSYLLSYKRLLFSGNPLWLLGVDAPTGQKSFFQNVQKFWNKIVGMHLHILCSPTKFCKKKIFFGAYVKKDKILWYKITIYVTFFLSFLYKPQKMSFHTKTFMNGHSTFICILRIFYPIFLIFLNAFKMYFHNRSICSYEPKHHVRNSQHIKQKAIQ
jgi:hypothetical protein